MEGQPSRATAFPADLLDALKQIDLTPLAPKAVLYVHTHQAAIDGVATDAVTGSPGSKGSDRSPTPTWPSSWPAPTC